ncbi:hypothetical protein N9S36_00935 [bacterium]|nr:hypothetical protein [bacterium]
MENLHKTLEGIETSITNEGVLKQSTSLDIRPKRTCIKNLNKRLIESQKKDKIKNTVILCTIFFSIGAFGFIVG